MIEPAPKVDDWNWIWRKWLGQLRDLVAALIVKYNNNPSVVDYGAIGDGVNLDSASIQAAIDAKDCVHFSGDSSTTYLIDDSIQVSSWNCLIFDSGVTLKMKDSTNKPLLINKQTSNTITGSTKANPCNITAVAHGRKTGEKVIIESVGGMVELNDIVFDITVTGVDTFTLDGIDSSAYTTYTSGGTATGDSNVSIIGGIFDPNQTAQIQCMYFQKLYDSYFERVEVMPTYKGAAATAAWQFGIPAAPDATSYCHNNVLRDCIMKEAGGEGLLLIGTHNRVIGGEYSDCSNGSGVQASGKYLLVDSVIANNNDGSSISVHGENVKVTNCTVIGGGAVAGTNGINMGHAGDPVTNSVISGNTIKDWGGANGIRCNSSSTNVIIADNVVTGMTRVSSAGIGVGDGSTEITINGNRVKNCVIGLAPSSVTSVISNNTVEQCTSNGISMSSGVGNIISNNIVKNGDAYGVYLNSASTNNIVTGNQIFDDQAVATQTRGVVCDGGPKTITGASKANPCVITAVSHVLTTGTRVVINNVAGMVELNDTVYTITVLTGNTLSLDGIDSSAFTLYTSGGTITPLFNLITNNYIHGHTAASLNISNLSQDVHSNRVSILDPLIVPTTLSTGAGNVVVTNENIVFGSRITLVPTSANALLRDYFIASQGFNTCTITANASGGASDTINVIIN